MTNLLNVGAELNTFVLGDNDFDYHNTVYKFGYT